MKILLEQGGYYHIFNRGVDKRDIFLDKNDYLRFIYNLIVFNKTDSHLRNTDRVIMFPCRQASIKPLRT